MNTRILNVVGSRILTLASRVVSVSSPYSYPVMSACMSIPRAASARSTPTA